MRMIEKIALKAPVPMSQAKKYLAGLSLAGLGGAGLGYGAGRLHESKKKKLKKS